MNLIDVKTLLPGAIDVLYEILKEREGEDGINISHRRIPTFAEHKAFVENHPYAAWYLIEVPELAGGLAVGSIYLTKPPMKSIAGNEIGIFIGHDYRGRGLGKRAVQLLMAHHGELEYHANINPENFRSQAMFSRLGFQVVQHTYRLTRT